EEADDRPDQREERRRTALAEAGDQQRHRPEAGRDDGQDVEDLDDPRGDEAPEGEVEQRGEEAAVGGAVGAHADLLGSDARSVTRAGRAAAQAPTACGRSEGSPRSASVASSTGWPKASPRAATRRRRTSATVVSTPSDCREHTSASVRPHGTMPSKSRRSVVTLKASPWLVTRRAMRTPIATSLRSPTHTPVRSGSAWASIPNVAAVLMQASSSAATW